MAKSETEAVLSRLRLTPPPLSHSQGRRRGAVGEGRGCWGICPCAIYKDPGIYDACYRAQDAKDTQQAKTMTKGAEGAVGKARKLRRW